MRTLGEPARLQIVALLADGSQRTSGEIAQLVGLPASTCSYHLKQLVASGITECWSVGTARYPTLRREALEERFPGLLHVVLAEHSG
ncbi:ArsR/SmtB family transcription factor [Mycobacterium sp. BMJ-28]